MNKPLFIYHSPIAGYFGPQFPTIISNIAMIGVSKVAVCGPNLQSKRPTRPLIVPILSWQPSNSPGWWFWLVGGESKWESWRDTADHAPKQREGGQCIMIPNDWLSSLDENDRFPLIALWPAVHPRRRTALPALLPRHQAWTRDWCGFGIWAVILCAT